MWVLNQCRRHLSSAPDFTMGSLHLLRVQTFLFLPLLLSTQIWDNTSASPLPHDRLIRTTAFSLTCLGTEEMSLMLLVRLQSRTESHSKRDAEESVSLRCICPALGGRQWPVYKGRKAMGGRGPPTRGRRHWSFWDALVLHFHLLSQPLTTGMVSCSPPAAK